MGVVGKGMTSSPGRKKKRLNKENLNETLGTGISKTAE